MKITSDKQRLEVQHQQLSESWALLKQINKDLELQIQNGKERTSKREPEKEANKADIEETRKKVRREDMTKNDSKIKPTRERQEKSKNHLTVKIMAKRDDEGENGWKERDISIGTVDESYEKKPTQFMMIIEEDVRRNTRKSDLDTYDRKRKVCKHFLHGHCRFNRQCWYLHERPDSRKEDKFNKEEQYRTDKKDHYRQEPLRKQSESYKRHSSYDGEDRRENENFLWRGSQKYTKKKPREKLRKDELSQ